MSICVGEEHDDNVSQLSTQELRHKVNSKIPVVEYFFLTLRYKEKNLNTKCLQTSKVKSIDTSLFVVGARTAGVCRQPADFEQ